MTFIFFILCQQTSLCPTEQSRQTLFWQPPSGHLTISGQGKATSKLKHGRNHLERPSPTTWERRPQLSRSRDVFKRHLFRSTSHTLAGFVIVSGAKKRIRFGATEGSFFLHRFCNDWSYSFFFSPSHAGCLFTSSGYSVPKANILGSRPILSTPFPNL